MKIQNELKTFSMLFSNESWSNPQDKCMSYEMIITTYPGSIIIKSKNGQIKYISEKQFFALLDDFFKFGNKEKGGAQLHYAKEYEILIQERGEKDKRRNVTCLLSPGEEFTISIQPPKNDNK